MRVPFPLDNKNVNKLWQYETAFFRFVQLFPQTYRAKTDQDRVFQKFPPYYWLGCSIIDTKVSQVWHPMYIGQPLGLQVLTPILML